MHQEFAASLSLRLHAEETPDSHSKWYWFQIVGLTSLLLWCEMIVFGVPLAIFAAVTTLILGSPLGINFYKLVIPVGLWPLFSLNGTNIVFVLVEYSLYAGSVFNLLLSYRASNKEVRFCSDMVSRISNLPELSTYQNVVELLDESLTQLNQTKASSAYFVILRQINSKVDSISPSSERPILDNLERHFDLRIAFTKTAIWALPAIGFLSTVVGLTMGFAVFANLSPDETVATPNSNMLEFLAKFSTAFIATFWGLILTVFLAFTLVSIETAFGKKASEVDQELDDALKSRVSFSHGRKTNNDDKKAEMLLARVSARVSAEVGGLLEKHTSVEMPGLKDGLAKLDNITNSINKMISALSASTKPPGLTPAVFTPQDRTAFLDATRKVEQLIGSVLGAYEKQSEFLSKAMNLLILNSNEGPTVKASVDELKSQVREHEETLNELAGAFSKKVRK